MLNAQSPPQTGRSLLTAEVSKLGRDRSKSGKLNEEPTRGVVVLAEKPSAEERGKRSERLFSGGGARQHRRQDEKASELPHR